MLGAIVGDIVGAMYEFNNIKTTEFDIFRKNTIFTDDTVMTIAVANWILRSPDEYALNELEKQMVSFGEKYPYAGYGGMFRRWLFDHQSMVTMDGKQNTERMPYNSFGNGSAMRVSPVGWAFDTLEETLRVAKISAEITHNHPEGIKGAQATAAAIFMARSQKTKAEIKDYIVQNFGYDLSRTCDEIRPDYQFDVTCQGTVPEAITAFLESNDFENAIRLAVSLGGDTDTLACITGGVAEAFYGLPHEFRSYAFSYLEDDMKEVVDEFYKVVMKKNQPENINHKKLNTTLKI